ncbi:uncharacterized protein JCM6883_005767 [Sporobolomyces salmoneus]|uniref:uncharacterized protein n=1 Tax=Sporobolomyces salmoneus TaxID=183962 RepID=UPI00317A5317
MSSAGYRPLNPPHQKPPITSYRTRIALVASALVIIGLFAKFGDKHRLASPKVSSDYSKGGQSNKMNDSIPRPNGKVNVGYFTNWGIYGRNYKPHQIPVNDLTHILYSFANLKEDTGEVHLTDSWADQEIHYENDSWNDENASSNLYGNLKQLYLLKKRNRSLKVLLSIGGWTYSENGRFGRGVGDDQKRGKFVESAVKLVEDYGLDGLDIDWEYPQNEKEARDYVLLLRDLRQGLDRLASEKGLQLPQGFELTIAAPCGPSTYEKLLVREMDQYLSFWNLMAYDYSGSWDSTANHQANLFGASPDSLSSDRAIRFYTSQGVPVQKLVLGMPLYGRSFLNCGGAGKPFQGVGPGSWEAGSYDYKALPLPSSQEHYDPHLVTTSCVTPNSEWITYDSPASALAKTEFINVNKLAGAMFWELSGDKPRDQGGIVGVVKDKLREVNVEGFLSFSLFLLPLHFALPTHHKMSGLTAKLTFPSHHAVKEAEIQTGIFINNEFKAGKTGKTIDVVDPSTGKVIASVAEGTPEDIDEAVEVAQKAYDTVWGERCPGHERGRLLMKLADLFEEHADTLASIESMDNGKAYTFARGFDVTEAAKCLRYYGGWADKDHGKVIEVDNTKMVLTRHEPIGVVGQIIPWNFPLLMFAWKLGPALAMGNTIVIKTAETTPLSAQYAAGLIKEVLPPGVVNIVTGYGNTVGAAISSHHKILKVAFTGSTAVGRQIMAAAAKSNLKTVTLELGGKSPNIVYDDADIDQAVSWAAFGLFFNAGQCCCAGSRVFVQEGIYDEFLEKLTAKVKSIKVGNPFDKDSFQGPATSQLQYDRVSAHIQSGVDEGATKLTGGERHGEEGYFIQPTIFTDVPRNAKIAKEEIFGPVIVVFKFKDEDDVVEMANDTMYGLAAAIFSQNITRALRTATRVQAGTVWVNNYNMLHSQAPFGGFKQSGIGRELGEYALKNYTQVKTININLGMSNPL